MRRISSSTNSCRHVPVFINHRWKYIDLFVIFNMNFDFENWFITLASRIKPDNSLCRHELKIEEKNKMKIENQKQHLCIKTVLQDQNNILASLHRTIIVRQKFCLTLLSEEMKLIFSRFHFDFDISYLSLPFLRPSTNVH
jgi:hypothetical protein